MADEVAGTVLTRAHGVRTSFVAGRLSRDTWRPPKGETSPPPILGALGTPTKETSLTRLRARDIHGSVSSRVSDRRRRLPRPSFDAALHLLVRSSTSLQYISRPRSPPQSARCACASGGHLRHARRLPKTKRGVTRVWSTMQRSEERPDRHTWLGARTYVWALESVSAPTACPTTEGTASTEGRWRDETGTVSWSRVPRANRRRQWGAEESDALRALEQRATEAQVGYTTKLCARFRTRGERGEQGTTQSGSFTPCCC